MPAQALTAGQRANYKTICRAAQAGDLALMDCRDRATGRPVAVLVAVHLEAGEYVLTPLARLFDGNPYDELDPPDPEGGYTSPEEAR